MMMYEREDINEILLNNARAMLHLNEKKMAAKIRKRERKNKKDRTTDAPVIIVVVPRGIFPFPFQRRALLRSRDPHNVLVLCCLLLFIVVLIIVVIILCGVLCLPNQNRLKNEKTEKKRVLVKSIFKPSSSLYIHTTHEKRLRDAIEESLCSIFFIIFRI